MQWGLNKKVREETSHEDAGAIFLPAPWPLVCGGRRRPWRLPISVDVAGEWPRNYQIVCAHRCTFCLKLLTRPHTYMYIIELILVLGVNKGCVSNTCSSDDATPGGALYPTHASWYRPHEPDCVSSALRSVCCLWLQLINSILEGFDITRPRLS